jgi:hypothetical protein
MATRIGGREIQTKYKEQFNHWAGEPCPGDGLYRVLLWRVRGECVCGIESIGPEYESGATKGDNDIVKGVIFGPSKTNPDVWMMFVNGNTYLVNPDEITPDSLQLCFDAYHKLPLASAESVGHNRYDLL